MDEPFDLDDECEGLLSMIQEICDYLHVRNLRSAESATESLLAAIEDAREREQEAEDAEEEEDEDTDE